MYLNFFMKLCIQSIDLHVEHYILHSMLKFSSAKKRIEQYEITQQFLLIN